MPFEKALHDLLEQPFGPYLEETILGDKCRYIGSKRLQLRDFQLAYNNEPTGFDRTEFEGLLTPSNVSHLAPIPSGSRVSFRAILSLHSYAHISEEGVKYLNHDFQERVTLSIVNGAQAARRYPALDLEAIFAMKAKQKDIPEAEKYNISVLIQGYMHSTASFMRSDLVPHGLQFHTANAAKTKFRLYQIISMDIETYKLSRTFLFRHHTLRLIRDILNTAGGGNGVPAHKCTPQWFLEQYFLHHAYPSRSKWQRINFLEGVESAVESSDEGSGIDAPPDAQTHTPRLLRTIHKNEVWSIFGSHSEWILSLMEKHKDLKGKVNTQSWKYFIMHVPQLRQRALFNPDTDGKWGLKDEQGDQVDISYIPPSSPPLPKAAVSQPQNHKGQKYKKKKPSTKVVSVADPPTQLSSRAFITAPQAQAEDQLDNIYDSDFTQGSLSPSDCHPNSWLPHSTAVHSPPPDPSLYALIPHEMLIAPALPPDMLWHCPVGGTCPYVINLYAPSGTNLRSISATVPQNEVVHFLKKGWKSNDEQVYTIFCEMVNAHWEDHLKELDIKYVHQGDACSFEWIHPQRHSPWPPKKWKLMRARRQQLLTLQQKEDSPEF